MTGEHAVTGHNGIDITKHAISGLSVSTAFAAFFDAIPWPQIAAFLSCVWLAFQIADFIYKKVKK
jgi:hypothetical protein